MKDVEVMEVSLYGYGGCVKGSRRKDATKTYQIDALNTFY